MIDFKGYLLIHNINIFIVNSMSLMYPTSISEKAPQMCPQ